MKLTHTFVLTCAAAALTLLAGCPKTIEIQGPTVYQEVLEEVDSSPLISEEVIRVSFDELNLQLKPDVLFREEMLTDEVRALVGRRISVSGVMWGGTEKPRGLERFVLMRNQPAKHGPGQPADWLVHVTLQPGETIDFTTQNVRVEGVFRIEPETGADGNTWSLYILDDATIPPWTQPPVSKRIVK
jgi:hypothetical protein